MKIIVYSIPVFIQMGSSFSFYVPLSNFFWWYSTLFVSITFMVMFLDYS